MNSKIFNTVLVVVLLALTMLGTWWMDGHRGVISTPALTHGNALLPAPQATAPAPQATLRTLDGVPQMLHDYQGKIILLNFWATWCTPCIAEWPQFINLARALQEDVVILAVSIDDEPARIAPFMKRYAPTFRDHNNIILFHDADKSVSQDLFQTVRVPETIIITPDMTMARKVAGLSLKWDSEDTIDYLRGLKAR